MVGIDLLGASLVKPKPIGGHQSPASKSETWLTPPEILDALGPFDFDPCPAPEPRPWSTATRHHDGNGLHTAWSGRVWLNPPYGGPEIIGPWMRRIADHNYGTALIFARTETRVFQEAVFGAATAVLFLAGRLHFHYPNGRRAKANAGAPSVLVAYGDGDAERLEASGIAGKFIRLRGVKW